MVFYVMGEICKFLEGVIGSSLYLYGLLVKEVMWLEFVLDVLDVVFNSFYVVLLIEDVKVLFDVFC